MSTLGMKLSIKLPTVSIVCSTFNVAVFCAIALMQDLLMASLINYYSMFRLALSCWLLVREIFTFLFWSSGERGYMGLFGLIKIYIGQEYEEEEQMNSVEICTDCRNTFSYSFNKVMKNYFLRRPYKTIEGSLKRQNALHSQDNIRKHSILQRSEFSQRRSVLSSSKHRQYSKSATKTPAIPYENFARELKIKLPTPKDKFYEFLRIQPFNRIPNHNELITLFLKNIKFFKNHQAQLVVNLAKKVKMVEFDQLDQKMMVVVLQGQCFYEGKLFTAGQVVNRKALKLSDISIDHLTKLISINIHEYFSYISSFIAVERPKFYEFFHSIQLFKMFNDKTIHKFTQYMTLHYYLKGQTLYKIGDPADMLYIIFVGKASRQVVIEIEKINKIPYRRFQRQVRIMSKTYSHHIQFFKQDIVGVTELIDGMDYRKEQVKIDEDSILIGIQRNLIQDNMDDYVTDRLKKYNSKKYPSSYDDLCSNYERDKSQLKRSQQRKISALQNELRTIQNQKRKQKIESIIKLYEENIKMVESKNLISKKLHFEVDYTK